MPFQSESQRRYLWMHDPKIAKKWADEYPGQKNLPMHKKGAKKSGTKFKKSNGKPASK